MRASIFLLTNCITKIIYNDSKISSGHNFVKLFRKPEKGLVDSPVFKSKRMPNKQRL
jgi:hypothetical protein